MLGPISYELATYHVIASGTVIDLNNQSSETSSLSFQ
jgi:hypothetical protein